MRYLLKDWGITGTTSPFEVKPLREQETPSLPAPIPPPGEEVTDPAERARKYIYLAETTLITAMTADDCPWSTKVTAAGMIYDRAFGRVSQPITAGPRGPITVNIHGNMSIQDKMRYAAETLAVLRETEEQAQPVDAEYTSVEGENNDEAVNQ